MLTVQTMNKSSDSPAQPTVLTDHDAQFQKVLQGTEWSLYWDESSQRWVADVLQRDVSRMVVTLGLPLEVVSRQRGRVQVAPKQDIPLPSPREGEPRAPHSRHGRRPLEWRGVESGCVQFFDASWPDREYLLPVEQLGSLFFVTDSNGVRVELHAEGTYEIEGGQDDLVIRCEGVALDVHEELEGPLWIREIGRAVS